MEGIAKAPEAAAVGPYVILAPRLCGIEKFLLLAVALEESLKAVLLLKKFCNNLAPAKSYLQQTPGTNRRVGFEACRFSAQQVCPAVSYHQPSHPEIFPPALSLMAVSPTMKSFSKMMNPMMCRSNIHPKCSVSLVKTKTHLSAILSQVGGKEIQRRNNESESATSCHDLKLVQPFR